MDAKDYVTRHEFKQLDSRVNRLEIQHTRSETRIDHVEKKLDKIDSNTTWILRLIVGGIIMAVLGFFIQGGSL